MKSVRRMTGLAMAALTLFACIATIAAGQDLRSDGSDGASGEDGALISTSASAPESEAATDAASFTPSGKLAAGSSTGAGGAQRNWHAYVRHQADDNSTKL